MHPKLFYNYFYLFITLLFSTIAIDNVHAAAAATSGDEEFSEIEQRRYTHLTLKIGDLSISETYQDPLIERLQEVKSTTMKGKIRKRNVATGSILFITEEDKIIEVELIQEETPIVFMSGIFDSLPDGVKKEESSIRYADKEGTMLYTFDFSSTEDDIVRYYYNLIVRGENLDIYQSSTPHKDKPELSGDQHLQSCFLAYFNESEEAEDAARKGEVEEWFAEKELEFPEYEKKYAFNEIVAFFGHSEQSLIRFIEANYEDLKSSIEEKKIKAVILNIVTYMDMCDNCFKTSYIKSRIGIEGTPLVVLVTGLTPHSVARLKYDSRSVEGRAEIGKGPIKEIEEEEINITELISTSDPKIFVRNYKS